MQLTRTSEEIVQFRSRRSLRPKARNFALDVLGRIQKVNPNKNRLIFLSFHFVFDTDEKKFRSTIEYLLKHFTIISYSEAVNIWKSRKIDRPYLCFSSDDGFDNYVLASQIFKDYNISGCVFVCPKMIGEKDFNTIAAFNKDRLDCPPIKCMDWKEIELVKKLGQEIGNHTYSHFNLSQISKDAMQEEIQKADAILNDNLGPVSHFAWPYGKLHKIQSDTIDFVYSLGYASVASTHRGYYDTNSFKGENFIRRNNFEPYWPLQHITYFVHTDKYQ